MEITRLENKTNYFSIRDFPSKTEGRKPYQNDKRMSEKVRFSEKRNKVKPQNENKN